MSAKPLERKRCHQCDIVKPRDDFDIVRDALGRVRLRRDCRECTRVDGTRVCNTCLKARPMDVYAVYNKDDATVINYYRKVCRDCLVDRVQVRRRMLNQTRPPGWTPAPTAAQLAEFHRDARARLTPPPGFTFEDTG